MTNTPTSGEPEVIWKASYEPFGNAVEGLDPDGDNTDVRMPVRFPGQWWDDANGLHYNGFRTYDPATGRYLEADPIGQAGGVNLYPYVDGDPLNRIDPSGQVLVETLVVLTVIGGALSAPLLVAAVTSDECEQQRTQDALAIGVSIPLALEAVTIAGIFLPSFVVATSPASVPLANRFINPAFAPQGLPQQALRGGVQGFRGTSPTAPFTLIEDEVNQMFQALGDAGAVAGDDPCVCPR